MRSPADADIQVIDILNRCFLDCGSCTRDIHWQTTTREMSPEMFRKALASLKDWWQPGKVIGIIGGEPTLAKNFKEICRIFREEFNPGELTIGREPIGDFNAFATERLFDRSNGKGLWTSFGPKWRDVAEDVFLTFSHWNSNDHSQCGAHQVSLVDAREMCDLLNIPWEKFPDFRRDCWLQNQWSGTITQTGKAYFCERAGHLDMLYNNGALGWDIEKEPHWWKRTPEQFGEQLSLCEMCSMCLPGPSVIDSSDRQVIGKSHYERLKAMNSPGLKPGTFEFIHDLPIIDQREITTKDNYVGESGIRVAADNKHVRPKKLSAVIVAVNLHLSGCADQIAATLNANHANFDQIVVVHGRFDPVQLLGLQQDVYDGVTWVGFDQHGIDESVTDSAFNKGAYLNAGLAALDKPDWILFLDADILLPDNFREFFFSHSWNPGCIYGFPRIESASRPGINNGTEGINGYAQLWHPRAKALAPIVQICTFGKTSGFLPVLPETFCSAGGIDTYFMQQFPEDKRIFVPDLAVTHLDHGEFSRRWNGHRTDVCWRQVGVIYDRRFSPCGDSLPLDVREGPPVPVRLTDTRYGAQWEGETLEGGNIPLKGLLEWKPDGCYFQGRNIGDAHIHVAMRF